MAAAVTAKSLGLSEFVLGDIDDTSVIFNVDVIHPQLSGNDALLELADRDSKPIWPG